MTRNEEKKLCAALSIAAGKLAESGLDYAELYMGRLVLRQALEALLEADSRPPPARAAAGVRYGA